AAHVAGGQIVAHYLKDASSRLSVYEKTGRKVRDVPLPSLGTVDALTGRHDGQEAFFAFSSYTVPPSVYRYDVKTGAVSLWQQVKTDVDLAGFDVNQVFYRSKDGTKVPMFLVHRKGIRLDGRNPTVLYGYGGFNISMTPDFSRAVVLWLEKGGIY